MAMYGHGPLMTSLGEEVRAGCGVYHCEAYLVEVHKKKQGNESMLVLNNPFWVCACVLELVRPI